MAYDAGLHEILAQDLEGLPGLSEKKMFGGICFMLHGNMLCGAHKNGVMYRVGKDNQDAAMALPDVGPMTFTGRPMGGFVDASPDAMADDTTRGELLRLALDFVGALPAK